jgi:hypothetical protein
MRRTSILEDFNTLVLKSDSGQISISRDQWVTRNRGILIRDICLESQGRRLNQAFGLILDKIRFSRISVKSWKMIKINTKVLILVKHHILAEISQNM